MVERMKLDFIVDFFIGVELGCGELKEDKWVLISKICVLCFFLILSGGVFFCYNIMWLEMIVCWEYKYLWV